MIDTLASMMESEFYDTTDTEIKEVLEFTDLKQLTESQVQLTGFIPAKVIVLKEETTGDIYVEFANNIERLMDDQKLEFDEAMEEVAQHYQISSNDMNVIISESDLDKLDLNKYCNEYSFVRK